MAVITPAHQKQIEAAIAGGKPEAALSVLQGYADLRHADMPAVSKAALEALARDPTAVRSFVLGAASTSLSVRRFCRKYLPKLGERAAGPLLALATESLDPFRPGEGLLGSFGGVVSPLARTVLDEKMSFEIKPNYAYSEAGRYGKEVMDDLVFLVGSASYDHLVRFCEYQWGSDRVAGLEGDAKRNWPHADYIPPWTHQTVQETLAKNSQRWGEALIRWTEGRTLLLDETSDDPVVSELARRVRERGAQAVAQLRETLLVNYATNFYGLSQEHRIALCRSLRAAIATMPPKLKPGFERAIDDYRRKYPGEAEEATRSIESAPAKRQAPPTHAAHAGTARADTSDVTAADESAGPGGERALYTLLRLAFDARLPRLHAAVSRSLDEDLRDAERPDPGGSAEDERILTALHQAILEHRTMRPDVNPNARPRFGEDTTYVPEPVLESAPFAAGLADLLIRLIGPNCGFRPPAAAATYLSHEGLRAFGEAWGARAQVDTTFYEDYANQILDPLAERNIAPVALLHALFRRQEKEFDLALGESWQRAVAMLYIRGGAAGREAALDLLARHPYPKEVNEYNNRRDFHDAHLGTMWAAWQRQDAEMLALAFERFALPYFWKGSKALLSKREPFFMRSGYAAASNTGEGAPLSEVWRLASSAGRSAATVKASLRHAELCEAPRTFLELAAPQDFGGLGDDVLSVLESSNATILATGLGILSRAPAVAGERAENAVALAARALSSTRTGAAKEAAVALAALGNAHPTVRQQAFSALADALALEAVPVLQAIIKSMKELPGVLPSDARRRIVELSRSDPAKFEKLSKPLLAA